jgi:hypothetical protein
MHSTAEHWFVVLHARVRSLVGRGNQYPFRIKKTNRERLQGKAQASVWTGIVLLIDMMILIPYSAALHYDLPQLESGPLPPP